MDDTKVKRRIRRVVVKGKEKSETGGIQKVVRTFKGNQRQKIQTRRNEKNGVRRRMLGITSEIQFASTFACYEIVRPSVRPSVRPPVRYGTNV